MENTVAGYSSNRADAGYADFVYPLGSIGSADKEPQWAFSLDNVVVKPLGKTYTYYEAGSRVAGASYSASGSWREVVDAGWTRFTAPLFGGFDGLNVAEIEPFRNAGMSGKTIQPCYAQHIETGCGFTRRSRNRRI